MNFLLEIGTEEIPASYLAPYSEQLKKMFAEEFLKLNLKAEGISTVFTPRRLTLFCENLSEKQPIKNEKLKGPPASVAFKDGAPTKAAEAFARKTGIDVDKLETKEFDGKEYLYAEVETGGADSVDLLKISIPTIIRKLRSPKSMRWEDKPTVFARPLRWIVAMLGDKIIPAELDGIVASNFTFGHRFIAPEKIVLENAGKEKYCETLLKAYVIVDAQNREEEIVKQLIFHGAIEEKIDTNLVSVCANLVEWPKVVRGSFPEEMLELPEEVLLTTLKKHQKSFLVYDKDGKVVAGFLSVANNDLQDEKRIRSGFERVIVARLADAKFFWDDDRKKKLADIVDNLKNVVFHEKLGTYFDKTKRIQELVEFLADAVGESDAKVHAARAAYLSRADLTTAMVNEFANLQGTMGRIYAKVVDGESDEVATAIEEMYQPRTADDNLPASTAGALLSIADKIDTIARSCAVGLGPTGSADPYALRRQSLGLLRTLAHHNFHISIKEILEKTLKSSENSSEAFAQVIKLFQGRLETVLKDYGVRYDVINAVLATGWDDVALTVDKAKLIMEIVDTENFKKVCTIAERCNNITKSEKLEDTNIDESLFSEPLEKDMWKAWITASEKMNIAVKDNNYEVAIKTLAEDFSDILHKYFDEVRVNAEDEKIKLNRLKCVRSIRNELFGKIANLSKIVF